MNKHSLRSRLEAIQEELKEGLGPHDSIRASDDQYEDPEEWWARPALDFVEKAIDAINRN